MALNYANLPQCN